MPQNMIYLYTIIESGDCPPWLQSTHLLHLVLSFPSIYSWERAGQIQSPRTIMNEIHYYAWESILETLKLLFVPQVGLHQQTITLVCTNRRRQFLLDTADTSLTEWVINLKLITLRLNNIHVFWKEFLYGLSSAGFWLCWRRLGRMAVGNLRTPLFLLTPPWKNSLSPSLCARRLTVR